MSLATFAGALAQLVFLLAVGLSVWHEWLRRPAHKGVLVVNDGLPERALGAILGAVVFCIAVMVAHIVTGGAVFGFAWAVPAAGLAVLIARARRARTWWHPMLGRVRLAALALGAVLLVVFVAPVVVNGSSLRTGDPPWHLGWTEQLLAGEPVPEGPAPEFGRNSYPWGYHAVLATMTRLVPGTTPFVAQEALHILLALAIPLAAACLARRFDHRAGWAGAAAAGLIGGFGWLIASKPDFVLSPSNARYGADLVVASPNSMYELFPSASPRELGLVLLAFTAVLIAIAVASGERQRVVLAGIAGGATGLVSVPLFLTVLLWTAVGSSFMPRGERLRTLGTMGGIALGLFALWAGPVVRDYMRFGGFVDITPVLGKEWPLPTALAAWGLLLPLAISGLVLAVRRSNTQARVVIACAATLVGLLVLALMRGRFDWDLAGNATILHQGRVWPPAHLLGAAFAGVAVTAAYRVIARRKKALAVVATALVFGVGAISPALASIRYYDVLRYGLAGYEYDRPDLGPGSFVRRAAAELDPDDVVRVAGSDELAFHLFELSGVRLATYDSARLAGNDLRIRFADLAAAWDERIADDGFEPDYEVRPFGLAPSTGRELVTGEYNGILWTLVPAS